MECHEDDGNDEISMALSPDTEAKVTLIDCMYSILYERDVFFISIPISSVPSHSDADSNGSSL